MRHKRKEMHRQQEDENVNVRVRHYPLVISASTYDSTLCGWKYMVSTAHFDTVEHQKAMLERHIEGKMERQGKKQRVQREEEEGMHDGDEGEEEDPEQVIRFLKAVEEEQKKVLGEKRERGVPVDDEKTEEFFDFLEAAEREQLRLLRARQGEEEEESGYEEEEEQHEEGDSSGGDDDDDGDALDYETLDAKYERSEEEWGYGGEKEHEKLAGNSEGEKKKKQQVKPLFNVDEETELLLPPEKTDTLYPLYSYTPHSGIINTLDSFGAYLVSGGNDETCVMYNMKSRKEQFVLNKMEGSITTARFLRNGRHVLIGTDKGTIDLHDFSVNMYCLWSAKAHKGEILDMSIHRSNKLFLSVGRDSTLKMWDLISGTLACSIKLRMSASSVMWSPTSSNFALSMSDTVQVYDTESVEKLLDLKHEKRVTCITYLSDKLIATGCEDKIVSIFDISNDGECLHRLEIHDSRVKSIAVTQVNAGEYILVSVSSLGGIAVWRVGTDFALLECYEKVGARFVNVKINGHASMRQFVEGREFFIQRQEKMLQEGSDDEETGTRKGNTKSKQP